MDMMSSLETILSQVWLTDGMFLPRGLMEIPQDLTNEPLPEGPLSQFPSQCFMHQEGIGDRHLNKFVWDLGCPLDGLASAWVRLSQLVAQVHPLHPDNHIRFDPLSTMPV